MDDARRAALETSGKDRGSRARHGRRRSRAAVRHRAASTGLSTSTRGSCCTRPTASGSCVEPAHRALVRRALPGLGHARADPPGRSLRRGHGLPLGPRRRGPGALLAGDIIEVVSDRDWVSFMWSYPNLIPLPAAEIQRLRGVVESLTFDRLYGAWWDRVIASDAKTKVLRSADRYLDAISCWRGQGEL